jgi:hypothetical protein
VESLDSLFVGSLRSSFRARQRTYSYERTFHRLQSLLTTRLYYKFGERVVGNARANPDARFVR